MIWSREKSTHKIRLCQSHVDLSVRLFSFLFFSLSFEIIKVQHIEILRATLSPDQQTKRIKKREIICLVVFLFSPQKEEEEVNEGDTEELKKDVGAVLL
jgi:hypothetical protein